MGRGQRSSEAVRSAQGLLFGPRRLQPIQPLAGEAGKAQVDAIIELMEADDNFEDALALLVRFNDEEGNEHLLRLARAMHEPILKASDEAFANLCSVIDQEIERDGNIPAFEELGSTLGQSIADRSVRRGLHQSVLDLLCRDHPLPEFLRQTWAERTPIPMMAYGDGHDEQTYLDDVDSYKLRQAVYQEVGRDYSEHSLWALRDSERLLDDLKAERPGTEAIIDEIEGACRSRGGARIFVKPAGSAASSLNQGLNEEQLGRLLRAMPDQDKIKQLLSDYAENEYSGPHFRDTIANMQRAFGDVDGSGEVAALSIDSYKRLDDTAKQLINSFAEETIAGRRDQVSDSYRKVLAEEMAACYDPANLSKKTRLFVNQNSSPGEDPFRAWQRFQHKHLSRSLLPDRKVEISQEEWNKLLRESITSNYGSPFSLSLSGHNLALGLSGIYRSRDLSGESVDPYC